LAVLCPGGPLKILVNLSQERNQQIPALLYTGNYLFYFSFWKNK